MVPDPFEVTHIERRAQLVEHVWYWAGSYLCEDALDAVLDSIPIGTVTGWVVVWETYNEGDYAARWTEWKIGTWVSLYCARRDKAPVSFVIDLDQIMLSEPCYECD